MNDQKQKQLAGLVELLLDGSADDSSKEEIADLLRDDPDAQQWYVEYCQMHAMLAWEHGALPDVVFDGVPEDHLAESHTPHSHAPHSQAINSPRGSADRMTRRWQWLALCASILFAASIGMLVYGRPGIQPVAKTTSDGIGNVQTTSPRSATGVLLHADKAVWKDSSKNAIAGDLIFNEPVQLVSGRVQIALFGGATITLDGPCQLDLHSSTRAYLKHGSIFVSVKNDNVQLEVDTPVGQMLHLGTEFGVSVTEAGETDMFVFEGAVEFTPVANTLPSRSSKIFGEGRATRLQNFGRITDLGQEEFESVRTKFDGVKPSLAYQPRPPTVSADGFTVRYMKAASSQITNLADADRLLAGDFPSAENQTVDRLEYVSFRDHKLGVNIRYPERRNALFPGEQPFPGDEGGFEENDNDFVIRATAEIVVQDAWIYSFLVNVDDGARLRIDGKDLIVDDGLHGPQISIGSAVLSPGRHQLELVAYDHERFCRVELACAVGDSRNIDDYSLLRSISSSQSND